MSELPIEPVVTVPVLTVWSAANRLIAGPKQRRDRITSPSFFGPNKTGTSSFAILGTTRQASAFCHDYSTHGRSSGMSRARILTLSLVAAITLGSGALAQGGGGGGGGAGGGASGAGGAAGGSGAGSAAGASGAHGAAGGRARPEQVTRTALLVFSPPAAQAKTLSTPRVRALARALIRPPRTNNSILRTDRDTVPPAAHWSAGSAECRRKATHSAPSTTPGSRECTLP